MNGELCVVNGVCVMEKCRKNKEICGFWCGLTSALGLIKPIVCENILIWLRGCAIDDNILISKKKGPKIRFWK